MNKPSSGRASPADLSSRPRGRPPLSHAEAESIRSQIKAAATQALAQHGYHSLSVELILQAGQISRATFYRYFSNTHEVVDQVLREVNDQLIDGVTAAIRSAEGPVNKVEAGLQAWRAWGAHAGPLLRVIVAEMHDLHSPVGVHRQRVLDALTLELDSAVQSIGRPKFDPIQIETFLIGVEYLGYRFHVSPEGQSDATWARTRQGMLRLAVGLLGSELEWRNAVQLAQILGIELHS